jgi:hypothetical protein
VTLKCQQKLNTDLINFKEFVSIIKCMYVCMYVSMYIHIYIYICVCIYIYII